MSFRKIVIATRASKNPKPLEEEKTKILNEYMRNKAVDPIPPKCLKQSYWSDSGFSIVVYPQTSMEESGYSAEEDFAFIMARNAEFEPCSARPWCIDGVCATGKTSLLSPERLVKTNDRLYCVANNTHISSALGYTFTSLELMQLDLSKVYDRTPYHNIYPWLPIWTSLASFGTDSSHRVTVSDIHNTLTNTVHRKTMEFLVDKVKCILLVDSNEEMARERLAKRNCDDDSKRARWPNYIRLQNLFYYYLATTYPKQFILIDLNAFCGDLSRVQKTINLICDRLKKSLSVPIYSSFAPIERKTKQILNDWAKEQERIRPLSSILTSEIASMCS